MAVRNFTVYTVEHDLLEFEGTAALEMLSRTQMFVIVTLSLVF